MNSTNTQRSERGVYIVLTALLIFVIFYFISLAIDIGKIARDNLAIQKAADASVAATIQVVANSNRRSGSLRNLNLNTFAELIVEKNLSIAGISNISTDTNKPEYVVTTTPNEADQTIDVKVELTKNRPFFYGALIGDSSSVKKAKSKLNKAHVVLILDKSASMCQVSGEQSRVNSCNALTNGDRGVNVAGDLKLAVENFLNHFKPGYDTIDRVMFSTVADRTDDTGNADNTWWANGNWWNDPANPVQFTGATNPSDALYQASRNNEGTGLRADGDNIQFVFFTDGAPTAARFFTTIIQDKLPNKTVPVYSCASVGGGDTDGTPNPVRSFFNFQTTWDKGEKIDGKNVKVIAPSPLLSADLGISNISCGDVEDFTKGWWGCHLKNGYIPGCSYGGAQPNVSDERMIKIPYTDTDGVSHDPGDEKKLYKFYKRIPPNLSDGTDEYRFLQVYDAGKKEWSYCDEDNFKEGSLKETCRSGRNYDGTFASVINDSQYRFVGLPGWLIDTLHRYDDGTPTQLGAMEDLLFLSYKPEGFETPKPKKFTLSENLKEVTANAPTALYVARRFDPVWNKLENCFVSRRNTVPYRNFDLTSQFSNADNKKSYHFGGSYTKESCIKTCDCNNPTCQGNFCYCPMCNVCPEGGACTEEEGACDSLPGCHDDRTMCSDLQHLTCTNMGTDNDHEIVNCSCDDENNCAFDPCGDQSCLCRNTSHTSIPTNTQDWVKQYYNAAIAMADRIRLNNIGQIYAIGLGQDKNSAERPINDFYENYLNDSRRHDVYMTRLALDPNECVFEQGKICKGNKNGKFDNYEKSRECCKTRLQVNAEGIPLTWEDLGVNNNITGRNIEFNEEQRNRYHYGEYFHATQSSELGEIFERIAQKILISIE